MTETTLAPEQQKTEDIEPMVHELDVWATRARGKLMAVCGYEAKGMFPDRPAVTCVVCAAMMEKR
jgi:hypothetical protein